MYILCVRGTIIYACDKCAQRIPYILHVRCTIYCTCDVRTAQWFWYVFIACAMRDNWCMTCAICSTNTIYIVCVMHDILYLRCADMPNDSDMYIMRVWCTIIYVCNVRAAQCFWNVFIACAMRDNWCMTCAICSTNTIYILHVWCTIYYTCDVRICPTILICM